MNMRALWAIVTRVGTLEAVEARGSSETLLTPEKGAEVKKLFSARERASTWRKLWLWLAEAEKDLGLSQITDQAVEAIRSKITVSDEAFQVIAAEERVRRHDVMSHVFALEKDAPEAAGLIHIGVTSCYGLLSTFQYSTSWHH